MTESENLRAHYQRLTEETLPSLGFEDSSIARIVAARLLIERLGERGTNFWWDSQVLTDFGRDRLEEKVPRTATVAQIDLAMEVGRKVEQEAVQEDALTLFDLGPAVEAAVERELDRVEEGNGLEFLHACKVTLDEVGWTTSLIENGEPPEVHSDGAFEIGEVSIEAMSEQDIRDNVVSELILAYGSSTHNDLHVPYYRLKS